MQKVTIWKRFNHQNESYELNHIESGHCKNNRPDSKSEEQKKSWAGAVWKKEWCYLKNDKVIRR
jgi:hypothetical protein